MWWLWQRRTFSYKSKHGIVDTAGFHHFISAGIGYRSTKHFSSLENFRKCDQKSTLHFGQPYTIWMRALVLNFTHIRPDPKVTDTHTNTFQTMYFLTNWISKLRKSQN